MPEKEKLFFFFFSVELVILPFFILTDLGGGEEGVDGKKTDVTSKIFGNY